jgi:hypothetical protein
MTWASVVGSFYVEGFGPEGLQNITLAQLRKRHREFCRMVRLP